MCLSDNGFDVDRLKVYEQLCYSGLQAIVAVESGLPLFEPFGEAKASSFPARAMVVCASETMKFFE